MASATARRAEAAASSSATGVRSPIAIASPCVVPVVAERHADIGDRHLPGTDQLIAADQAADGAIADRDQKGLVGDGRQPQHAIQRLAQVHGREFAVDRRRRRDAAHVAAHARRLAQQRVDRHVHGVGAEQRDR